MSKMVPITSPDLILSFCMEPGHREPLDQLFKRWLDLLQYPLLGSRHVFLPSYVPTMRVSAAPMPCVAMSGAFNERLLIFRISKRFSV